MTAAPSTPYPDLPDRDPHVGEMVRVRTRHWLVEEVVSATRPDESSRVRLACADDDAQGQELEVFWDCELDRAIVDDEPWSDLGKRGFDSPGHFAAFLNTLRWSCTTATDPSLFQAPFRAGIKIDAYQMEPLRKALLLPRVNLFIADDTGLGKTIEAGLIVRELLLRRKVRTIVVAAPPSVIVLDEAHHAAPSHRGRYGIESKFTRAVRDLCDRFEHRLFLSATPKTGTRTASRPCWSCSIRTASHAASGCAGRRTWMP